MALHVQLTREFAWAQKHIDSDYNIKNKKKSCNIWVKSESLWCHVVRGTLILVAKKLYKATTLFVGTAYYCIIEIPLKHKKPWMDSPLNWIYKSIIPSNLLDLYSVIKVTFDWVEYKIN